MKGSLFSIAVLCLCALALHVQGFGTGHHTDASNNVLMEKGYNEQAMQVAALTNFLTDFYSQSPLSPFADTVSASELHFDSLPNRERVQNYWDNLAANTKNTIDNVLMTDAISDDDRPLYFLSTLGITLHAVQDFYTHSHWVPLNTRAACSCFRADTWFNRSPSAADNLDDLYTGLYDDAGTCTGDDTSNVQPHGAYCQGENRDSYVRPEWREAYIFAFTATHEWVSAIEGWVTANAGGAELIEAAKNYVYIAPPEDGDMNDLESNTRRAYEIASFVDNDSGDSLSADGHWKGYLSGDLSAFGDIVPGFIQSDSVFKDVFEQAEYHANFSPNLYCFASSTDVPTVNPASLGSDRRAVVVRISSYEADTNSFDEPDVYAMVTINGQEFRDSTIRDEEEHLPMWYVLCECECLLGVYRYCYLFISFLLLHYRTSIHLIDMDDHVGDVVEITIRFFEEDIISSDDVLKVNGDAEVVTLQYDVISNTVSGDATTTTATFTGSGSESVEFEVSLSRYDVGGCVPEGTNAGVVCDVPLTDRRFFCHAAEAVADLCLQDGSSSCNVAQVKADVVAATWMNPLDVEVETTCAACSDEGVEGVRYSVTLLSPTRNDAKFNRENLFISIENNGDTLGSFDAVFYRSASTILWASPVLVLAAAVVALLV